MQVCGASVHPQTWMTDWSGELSQACRAVEGGCPHGLIFKRGTESDTISPDLRQESWHR